MAVATFTKTGSKATTPAKLDKAVFGVEVQNHDLLKQAYVSYLANGRSNFAQTKKRGEVRGGGKKPWRQKGTGRARFGSSRNPIWRGGGIAFGPTGNENYSRKLNTTAKRQALCQALSLSQDKIKIIETFECKDGKVKPTVNLLDKIGATRSVLLVVSAKDELVDRATRNLLEVKAVQAKYLNVYDVLNAHTIVISKKALDMVHEWLGGKK
jgi:large subunit ribosomal protein L4